ncbi:MAG TPA: DUF559 domain-containing protein [Verrucomicrobiae bacterium]|nr:DUF559 domain-containing protein [Verrucomicrobiae bacterium]
MQGSAKTRIARALRKKESWAEKLIWSWFRGRRFSGYKFRRQYPLGDYILNFFCLEARLNVEVDGFQHGMRDNKAVDAERDAWLEAHGVKVLRFWNSHLRREKQEIRDAIWRALQERAPHPLPEYCRPGLCKSTELSSGSSPHPGPLPRGEGDAKGDRLEFPQPESPPPRVIETGGSGIRFPSPQGRELGGGESKTAHRASISDTRFVHFRRSRTDRQTVHYAV